MYFTRVSITYYLIIVILRGTNQDQGFITLGTVQTHNERQSLAQTPHKLNRQEGQSMGRETEAQESKVTCSSSHSRLVTELGR